jgi:hypothetical protein
MPADFGGGWVQVRYLLPGAHPKRQVLYNQNSPVKQLNSHIGCGRVTWEGMRNLMLGGDLPGGISHMLVCKPAWGLNADSMCSWRGVRLTLVRGTSLGDLCSAPLDLTYGQGVPRRGAVVACHGLVTSATCTG